MGIPTVRKLNARKLNTTHLYSSPYRRAIVILQCLLLLFAVLTFALTFIYISQAADFRHWNFIWLYVFATIILYHPIEILRRYLRLSDALEVTVSASIVLLWWIFVICLEALGGTLLGLCVAPIGLVLAMMYVGFAADALRRDRRGKGKEVELDEQLPTGLERSPSEQRTTSQESILAESQAVNQKWSPLGR